MGILGLFLYFPEDKTEYIPAAITCVIFLIMTVMAFRFFVRHSKREEAKMKQLEERIMMEKDEK